MRVRTYFIVFTVLLALNLLPGQCPSGLPELWDSWLRWAAGVLSLVCLVLFYRKVMKPFRLIETGMTLLKEQDFGSRLHPVGQHDADRIVHLFNRMMEQLKRERLHVREQNQLFDLSPIRTDTAICARAVASFPSPTHAGSPGQSSSYALLMRMCSLSGGPLSSGASLIEMDGRRVSLRVQSQGSKLRCMPNTFPTL